MVEVPTWTFLLMLCCVGIALGYCASRLIKRTPRRSGQSSSADPVWRGEVDQELADLDSRVTGLSSTLRKLHGRESTRQARSSPEASPPEAFNLEAERARLRRLAGVVK